ncbi:unnamed protein product, partial [Amoebophrya sp. A25]|eukprot:GSA25T00018372001.1
MEMPRSSFKVSPVDETALNTALDLFPGCASNDPWCDDLRGTSTAASGKDVHVVHQSSTLDSLPDATITRTTSGVDHGKPKEDDQCGNNKASEEDAQRAQCLVHSREGGEQNREQVEGEQHCGNHSGAIIDSEDADVEQRKRARSASEDHQILPTKKLKQSAALADETIEEHAVNEPTALRSSPPSTPEFLSLGRETNANGFEQLGVGVVVGGEADEPPLYHEEIAVPDEEGPTITMMKNVDLLEERVEEAVKRKAP